MSNNIVPTVYGHIMKDVLNNVHKDFEENGIDVQILQDLEKLWETKLSSSNVANFEAFTPRVIPTSSNVTVAPTEEDYSNFYDKSNARDNNFKPTNSNGNMPYPMIDPSHQPDTFAAANLANIVNSSSLNTLQPRGSMPLSHEEMYVPKRTLPPYKLEYPSYTPDLNYNNSNTKPSEYYNENQSNSRNLPQLDGANDEPLNEKESKKIFTREEADKALHKMILKKYSKKTMPQLDGDAGGDDEAKEDEDEDAINSDLDDSDEGDGEDGDAGGTEHIILCQYDKVSRTKNRWRCNLKDGIILVNGKDYLFSKATGEFQW